MMHLELLEIGRMEEGRPGYSSQRGARRKVNQKKTKDGKKGKRRIYILM
jgi:hypothetical protein